MRFPAPLRPGDLVAVTSPSSGVDDGMRPRLDAGVRALRERGYDVVVGECMSGDGVVSAPAAERAAELTAMLCDPQVRAVVPPWGGELGIDLVDLLDWDALAAADPTWAVGFSDTTVWMLPLTLRLGWATLTGANLMDTRYAPPAGLVHWTDLAAATGPVVQRSPGRFRADGGDDYRQHPDVAEMTLDTPGTWSVLGRDPHEPLTVSGRLVGGCLEVVSQLAGSAYADVAAFGREHAEEGLLVHLEAAEWNAYDVGRALHGLRLAGWFDHATAVLVGRTSAPDSPGMTQHQAVADAIGRLGVPVVLDVDCGHVQPNMPLVYGSLAQVVLGDGRPELSQRIA